MENDYKLEYRVVETYPEERLFVVRFLCDFMSEHELKSDPRDDENGVPLRCRTDVSIEVPLEYGKEISEEELEALIWAQCPRQFFEKLYALKKDPEQVKLEIPIGKKKVLPVTQIDAELENLGKKRAKEEALKSLELSEEEWNLLIGS